MSGSESQDHSQIANSKPHKLFITGLDGKWQLADLQAQLRKIFSKYGQLVNVVPKKSYNHQYCYAFIDFKEDVDATVAMKKQNNSSINGAKITITIQDNSRRKKGVAGGCYKCGKPGHFARDCREADDKSDRSSSRDRSQRKKKKKRKHSSDYSRSRSHSARKKQKKKRSKSRGKKHSKSKKSKKQRRRSGSRSD